eukprot:TRINITY_DN51396_c0_g4_i1.p1 TRINITY_DN51396_c0_g4~~TRINITY_DN51396_c0_g4_i1.p1  ORF type:complete len:750 (+),score=172.90 TRINITY_DN51396_c0_g4_i1:153-2402(+)
MWRRGTSTAASSCSVLSRASARPLRRLLRDGHAAAIPAATAAVPCRSSRRGFFFSQKADGKLFDIDGLARPGDFPRLAHDAVVAAKKDLKDVHEKGPAEIVTALDQASNHLCRIADAAELCRNVHPDQAYVEAANDAVAEIAGYMGEVNLDATLYQGMVTGEKSAEFQQMSPEYKVVLSHMRQAVEHEGIHLPEAEKVDCLRLQEHEQQLSFGIVQQSEQRRSRSPDQLDGIWLPSEKLQAALGGQLARLPSRKSSSNVDEVRVPADQFWSEHILKHTPCSATRQAIFEAQRAADDAAGEGEEAMAELRGVRHRLASLRGYGTWAEYAQRESLFQSPDRVGRFLDSAWERLKPGLEEDLKRLAALKESEGLGEARLQAWDIPFLFQRSNQLQQDEEAIVPYLSYASLMKGVDLILSRLLGLSFVPEEPGPGEVWHPSVQKYTLRDGDRKLGVLYLDPFARQGKTVQSAQFTLQGSKLLTDGSRQIPVTTLVYALPVGSGGLPFNYAVTFMHEIGHALHSLLSETDLQHLSGTRGSVDFVEFPSHLFEHFVMDPRCLRSYATHWKTGEKMPETMDQRIRRGLKGCAHLEAVQQLMYAVVDQAFYAHEAQFVAEDGTAEAAAARAAAAKAVQEQLAEALARFDRDMEHGPFDGPVTSLLSLSRPSKFDHLIHYGGSYYCYLFNRALSAHVWRHGFQDDPFGKEAGQRLRDLLRKGSVVQSFDAIQALCPGQSGLRAEEVPLDAFVDQLHGL